MTLARAPRLCRCGLTIAAGQPCPVCRAARAPRKDGRASAAERGYDDEWRKATAGFLARHPHCAACARAGLVTKAEVVGHVVSIRQDPSRRLDPTNWTPLCRGHNARDALRERKEGGRSKTFDDSSQTTAARVGRNKPDFSPPTPENSEPWPW